MTNFYVLKVISVVYNLISHLLTERTYVKFQMCEHFKYIYNDESDFQTPRILPMTANKHDCLLEKDKILLGHRFQE